MWRRWYALWAAGLFAVLLYGCSEDPTPTPSPAASVTGTPTPAPTPSSTPTPSPTPMPLSPPDISAAGYTQQQVIDYYMEIAFGAEHETSPSSVIHKWTRSASVCVDGATEEDLQALRDAVSDLSQLTGREIAIEQVGNCPEEFHPYWIYLDYRPEVIGVGGVPSGGTFAIAGGAAIRGCRAAVDSDPTPDYRAAVAREELTQCLGLLRDSFTHEQSIFFDEPNPVITQFTPIDEAIIRLHYWSEIRPGMTQPQVRELFAGAGLTTS